MDPNTVCLQPCPSYEQSKVKEALETSISQLGGLAQYIKKEERVLLKTNLLMAKKPETAATTHPAVIQALAEILIEYGAKVIIGDSPGGPFRDIAMKPVYAVCGMEDAAKNSGASLNWNFKTREVSFPQGFLMKKLTVTDMLFDVDKVISVSKLKTHGMAKMTGAVKNLFGIIPGTMKAEYHLNRPDIGDFAVALIDICRYANPVLSFMDAIVAMEGDGPSSGTPRALGAVLASANPFALDVAAAKLIGLDPLSVPTIQKSIEHDLCPADIINIPVIGTAIETLAVSDFKIPLTKKINPFENRVPKFLEGYLSNRLQPRPVFLKEKCISCGRCRDNCPPGAIEMENQFPKLTLEKCIRCFCCQELCPKQAVEIKRPLLFRLLSKL